MNDLQKKILEKNLGLKLEDDIFQLFQKYTKLFLEFNAHTNLISKNDEKFLFEKHIFDSLALNLFLKNHSAKNLLDIGTGGGFPSVPAAIAYPSLEVYALDSIAKKLKFIDQTAKNLDLKNLQILNQRAEIVPDKLKASFDIVTARAVSKLEKIITYAAPYLKRGGYFIAFKSKTAEEEVVEAKSVLKKYKLQLETIIDYSLPLEENFERKLLVFKSFI